MKVQDNDPHNAACPVETGWTLPIEHTLGKQRLYWLTRYPLFNRLLLLARMARDTWTLGRNFFYDFQRVRKHSSAVRSGDSRSKLAALITKAYHGLEKGMSLPNPRPGFGEERVAVLVSRLERYGRHYGFDDTATVAFKVLQAYRDFNAAHGVVNQSLNARLESLKQYGTAREATACSAGVKLISRQGFLKSAKMDLQGFFASRSSARQYTEAPVEIEAIRKAVDMAKKSPCCCNRQSSKVFVIQDASKIQRALDIQAGARGFKEQVKMLLVVSSDLASFTSEGERYQSCIDGALFGMTLVYALHSMGLVTCMLNWSKNYQTDTLFKKEFSIPDSETIVFLVSVGHPPDEFQVAQSHRHRTDYFIKIL